MANPKRKSGASISKTRNRQISSAVSRSADFDSLVRAITEVHEHLAAQAGRAVNVSLTMRNWFIGVHIAEYELHGADRAKYGENLLAELAKRLTRLNVSNCNRRQLYRYLRFYRLYPRIVGTLPPQLAALLPGGIGTSRKVGTPPPRFQNPPERLIHGLSYSHIELIVDLDDEMKRSFYEIECIRGNWSVRELKRQIGSLYYERSGLSMDKAKLAEMIRVGAETAEPRLAVRDPYVFEFLGIKPREVMGESDLEDALLDKLQDFLLELGYGFCFEARQKRILIGHTHGFVDLVFYHRVLKCHVLVELKVAAFTHEHLGQLNTYVSWYSKHMMTGGDNPPVGILLCTQKDHALVEYALAGMDNHLFVSKYQLELPKKEEMQRFIEKQVREVGNG
jgi:predicted nuclease of restriction endonuclease-like (RecB) superfamily